MQKIGKTFRGMVITCRVNLTAGGTRTYMRCFDKTNEKEIEKFKSVIKELGEKGYKPHIREVELEI